ncbi:MAG TPA: CoA transferase, partial [Acidimicrobiales bacterium]|nr:CoA transferase [Acidimicrobiales bacterium]
PAADGRWLAVGAIEHRFFANLCQALGCEQWVDHQFDDDVQEKMRDDFRAAFARRERDAWVELLSASDTCVAPVLAVEEVAEDPQFAARAAVVAARRPDGATVRQVGPVLAGAVGRGRPVDLPAEDGTETDELLAEAGIPAERRAELRARGVVA